VRQVRGAARSAEAAHPEAHDDDECVADTFLALAAKELHVARQLLANDFVFQRQRRSWRMLLRRMRGRRGGRRL